MDIEAGEETSSTDGIIELESLEYEESESSVILELEEDYLDVDVDVSIAEIKDEEGIEAILPKSPVHDVSPFLTLLNKKFYLIGFW